MALRLQSASTQYVRCTTPLITDYPFTMAAWANLAAVGSATRAIAALGNTGASNMYLGIQMNGSEAFQITAAAGGASSTAATSELAIAGSWAFVVGRFVSSTLRRLSVLKVGGGNVLDHAASSGSQAPTGLNTIAVGCRYDNGGANALWNGHIGEFWICAGDANIDTGSTTNQALMYQLAFGGPFSVPHVAGALAHYRSFRCGVDSRSDIGTEAWAKGGDTWAATGSPVIGMHPPLPYWYERPGQVKTQLVF